MNRASASNAKFGLLIVCCAAAIVLAIIWPRIVPRYQRVPGGIRDTWRQQECTFITDDDACFFLDGSSRSALHRGEEYR